MTVQTLTKSATILDLVASLAHVFEKPVHVSSRDYGFDYDPEELAKELSAPLPKELSTRAAVHSAEEYDARSLCLF